MRLVRIAVDCPTFGATLPACCWILRGLAPASIKRRVVSAHAPRVVDDAVSVGEDTACSNQFEILTLRRLVHFRPTGFRRVRPLFDPDDFLVAFTNTGTPQASVFRVH